MTSRFYPSLRAAVAVMLASMLGAACEVNLNTEGLASRDTKTYQVTGAPDVVLETFDGAIEIHSWDRNEVEVEVEKRAMDQSLIDQIKVEAEQKGNTIVIRVTGPAAAEFHGLTIGHNVSPSGRLRVAVPRVANLQAKSGDGSIRAEEVDGKIVLNTRDGSVTVARLSGDLQIRTGDGSIRMDRVSGKVDLETNDGSITFTAKPTVLRAKTGDGSIRATIDMDAVMSDNWDITTGDGSVVLSLPSSFNAELDAETSDGSVRATHPELRDEQAGRRRGEDSDERRERRRTLRSKMGDGGKTLRVRTGDGTIRIES
ncbi:MAG: DUF4097 family beta strand repeat-containing protein [Vicinamibacterales bacterium]